MDSNSKITGDRRKKSDSSLIHSDTSSYTVSKGEKLIQDIFIAFNNASNRNKLWKSINHEKWRLGLGKNYVSSEASRVLQGLENAVRDNIDIQKYCQQENVQKILKKNEKLQKALERIINDTVEDSSSQLDLTTAIRGVELFKKIYETGNKELKQFLTKTTIGEELQALLLGLKPQVNVIDTKYIRDLQKIFAEDDLVINGDSIFSKSSVKKILETYPHHFPDYTPGTPVEEYMPHHGRPFKTSTGERRGFTDEEIAIQEGLLFGYPLEEVEQFAKSRKGWKEFSRIQLSIDKQIQSLDDENELEKQSLEKDTTLFDELRKAHISTEILSAFKDKHKQEIIDIIEKYTPNMTEDIKNHIVQERAIKLRGFTYMSANPSSSRNRAFTQKVNDTFRLSGMDDFLKQVTSE